jgi:hypothetical protein
MALLAVAAGGCEPKAGAVLAVDGEALAVAVASCGRPEQVLPLRSLQVHRLPLEPGADPVCWLSKQDPAARLDGAWRYGERVPGFELGPCAPLAPGRYRVHLTAGPSAAEAEFAVGADGSIEPLRGGCD